MALQKKHIFADILNTEDKIMNESIKKRILKLARNPYVQGWGSIAEIFGPSIVRRSGTLADDIEALRGDWVKVGNDMKIALDMYRKEAFYGK